MEELTIKFLKFMSHERGDLPPGAVEWKAPSTEESAEAKLTPEEEKEDQLMREISEMDRMEVSNVDVIREGEQKKVDFFPGDFLRNHRGEWDTNNGVICFIDRRGRPWVTPDTEKHREALGRAGYKSGEINIPLSNEEPAGREASQRWDKILVRDRLRESREARERGDEEEARRLEDSAYGIPKLTEERRKKRLERM